MQAQAPLAPYVGLWSRLVGFDAAELAGALVERRVVRASLMRSTIHLVTADDALAIRPLVQPVLDRGFRASPFARDLAGVDIAELLAIGRGSSTSGRAPGPRSGAASPTRWPERPPDSLVYAVTYLVPVVQVPPRGVWGRTGPPAWTTMEAWLGRPGRRAAPRSTSWSSATWPPSGRRRSWTSRPGRPDPAARGRRAAPAEAGGAPRRPRSRAVRRRRTRRARTPDVPAPPRFLPEYDNVLIGHADRSRIIPPGRRIPLPPGDGATRGTVLLDGMFAGRVADHARRRRARP